MFMMLFVCYVFISLFIMIFLCGYLMHVFRCFARIFVIYRQTNCRSNSTANFFQHYCFVQSFCCNFFFVRLQFDYKRSNFFRSNITHSHTIFFHISKFFAWLKKWPLTMCMFFSLFICMRFVCNSTFIFHLRCQCWHHWLIICYFRVLVVVCVFILLANIDTNTH